MTEPRDDGHDPTLLVELVRWNVVTALRFASRMAPGIGVASVRHVCTAAAFDDPARAVVALLSREAEERRGSGAIPLMDLLKLLGRTDMTFPPGQMPLLVAPQHAHWIQVLLSAAPLTADESLDVIRWAVLAFVVANVTSENFSTWEGRLASASDDVLETYAAVSLALVTGVAFSRKVVPPWLGDDFDPCHVRLVRAAWEGKEVYDRRRGELLGSDHVRISSVELTPELVARLDAEARRRGVGGFGQLDPEAQASVLGAVLAPEEGTS